MLLCLFFLWWKYIHSIQKLISHLIKFRIGAWSSQITLILIAFGEVVGLIVFVPHQPQIRCTLKAENKLTLPSLMRKCTRFDLEMVYVQLFNQPNDPWPSIV